MHIFFVYVIPLMSGLLSMIVTQRLNAWLGAIAWLEDALGIFGVVLGFLAQLIVFLAVAYALIAVFKLLTLLTLRLFERR